MVEDESWPAETRSARQPASWPVPEHRNTLGAGDLVEQLGEHRADPLVVDVLLVQVVVE